MDTTNSTTYICKHHNLWLSELADKWNADQSPVKDGVTFTAKYLGSTLVEELEDEAQSYGHTISAEAVKAIVTMV